MVIVKKEKKLSFLTLRDLSSLAVRRNLPPGCQEIPRKGILVGFREVDSWYTTSDPIVVANHSK